MRAPFDGRVRTKHIDIGQYVTAGAALARIYFGLHHRNGQRAPEARGRPSCPAWPAVLEPPRPRRDIVPPSADPPLPWDCAHP
ncbi:MAG: HlyD family efflux transporter periplasmic adaptor subunit [Gammaproteobacteria bacterium]